MSERVRQHVIDAERARGRMVRAMSEAHCSCIVGDKEGADAAREQYKDAFDEMLDAMWLSRRAGDG